MKLKFIRPLLICAIVAILASYYFKNNPTTITQAEVPATVSEIEKYKPDPSQDLCNIIKKGMSSKDVIAILGKERQVTFDRVDGLLFTLEYCPKGWGSCRNAVFSSKTKIVKEVECADGSRKKLI